MNRKEQECREEIESSIVVSRHSSATFILSNSDNEEGADADNADEFSDAKAVSSFSEERTGEPKCKAPKSRFSLTDDVRIKSLDQNDLLYPRQNEESCYSSATAEDVNIFDSHWFDMPSEMGEAIDRDSISMQFPSYQWMSVSSVNEVLEDSSNDDIANDSKPSSDTCTNPLIQEELKSVKLKSGSHPSIFASEITITGESKSATKEVQMVKRSKKVGTSEDDGRRNANRGKADKEVQTTPQEMVVVMVSSSGRGRRLGTESPHDAFMHYIYGKEPTGIFNDTDLHRFDMRGSWPLVFHGEELLPNIDEECQGALDSVRDLSIGSPRSSSSTVGPMKPTDSGVSSTENESEAEEQNVAGEFALSLCGNLSPKRKALFDTMEENEEKQLSDNERAEKSEIKEPLNKRKSPRRRLRKFLCFSTT